MSIEDRIIALAKETKGVIDIRYCNETFAVMSSLGNWMQLVPGTVKPTIDEALTVAEKRWKNRSIENPYM